ncbi:MAG: hypothetical protein AB7T49_11420 [Oligoflexales bacterium]
MNLTRANIAVLAVFGLMSQGGFAFPKCPEVSNDGIHRCQPEILRLAVEDASSLGSDGGEIITPAERAEIDDLAHSIPNSMQAEFASQRFKFVARYQGYNLSDLAGTRDREDGVLDELLADATQLESEDGKAVGEQEFVNIAIEALRRDKDDFLLDHFFLYFEKPSELSPLAQLQRDILGTVVTITHPFFIYNTAALATTKEEGARIRADDKNTAAADFVSAKIDAARMNPLSPGGELVGFEELLDIIEGLREEYGPAMGGWLAANRLWEQRAVMDQYARRGVSDYWTNIAPEPSCRIISCL